MPNPLDQAAHGPTSRAEKLSILSAMLGPDAMARIRDAAPGTHSDAKTEDVEVDADRATWHRNRLLERLRQQGLGRDATANRASMLKPLQPHPLTQPTPHEPPPATTPIAVENPHLDARLAKIADGETLGNEHPAIIARLIKTLPRDARVDALKSLPGPVARSIVRRLR